jgi:uncharacterized protein (TIGR02246 family)
MMRLLTACSVGAVLLLTSCRTASFDPEDPEILSAIDSVMQSVMAGAAAANADQVLAAAEGEGELTFITGEVMLSGIDTVRARFEDTYAAIQSQHQDILEKRVRILSPDVALVLAVGEGTYTDKAGWTSDPVGIGTTLVFVRENGQWRIRHAHQSIVR